MIKFTDMCIENKIINYMVSNTAQNVKVLPAQLHSSNLTGKIFFLLL